MIIFALTGLFFFAPLGFALDNEAGIDLLIVSGSIVDGTGAPSYLGYIAIKHGRIIEIGNLKGRNAKEVLNADGLVVAPGFIDLHSHGERTSAYPGKVIRGSAFQPLSQALLLFQGKD